MTGRRAMDLVMGSFAGWAYVSPAGGLVEVGALIDPVTSPPAITISSLNLTGAPDLSRRPCARTCRIRSQGRSCGRRTASRSLAGITHEDKQHFMTDARLKLKGASALHRFYRDRVGADPYRTVFDDEADLQYQADRITALQPQARILALHGRARHARSSPASRSERMCD